MDRAKQVQFLGLAICVLQSTNALGKDINPTIIHPTMG